MSCGNSFFESYSKIFFKSCNFRSVHYLKDSKYLCELSRRFSIRNSFFLEMLSGMSTEVPPNITPLGILPAQDYLKICLSFIWTFIKKIFTWYFSGNSSRWFSNSSSRYFSFFFLKTLSTIPEKISQKLFLSLKKKQNEIYSYLPRLLQFSQELSLRFLQ